MLFSEVIGQKEVKEKLIQSYRSGRLSHAQLFFGSEGSGALPLALAFAQYITCEQPGETDSCGVCSSCIKNTKMVHPDVHYSFPVATVRKIQKPKSMDFLSDFRESVLANPYLNLDDWYLALDTENKQGFMSVDESADINRKLNLKSFESEYRILLMWQPEKMNTTAANKLLKIIEEPPDKTIFLLVTENKDQLLATTLSRLQLIKVKRISDSSIQEQLEKQYNLSSEQAKTVSLLSEGNFHTAQALAQQEQEIERFEVSFLQWMRLCFSPYKNTAKLLAWVDEKSKTGREQQKRFLQSCIQTVRECMIIQINEPQLIRIDAEQIDSLKAFIRFITPQNVEGIIEQLNQSCYHIERQANPKILFLDLSLQINLLLNQQQTTAV